MSGLRIGGLASGMDIDQIVGDLMKAERIPLDKLFQKKTTYEWQRDAFRSINTKLSSFDTYLFDNFIYSSNFNRKTVTGSNDSLVSAKATAGASASLSIEGVAQLATAARQVGSTVSTTSGGTASGSTKMSELGIADTTISLKAIQADGTLAQTATDIKINATDSIDQVIAKINNSSSGVSALFENGKLSITAKNTGDITGQAEVQVTAGSNVFSALGMEDSVNLADGGKNAIFQVNGISTKRSTNTFTISGYTVTLKSTFNVKNTLTENVTRLETEKNLAQQDVSNAQTANDAANKNLTTQQAAYDSAFAGLTPEQQATYDSSVHTSTSIKNALANVSESDLDVFKSLPLNEDGQIEDTSIESAAISTESKNLLKKLNSDERLTLHSMDPAVVSAFKPVAIEDVKLDIANAEVTRTQKDLTAKQQRYDQLVIEYDAAVAQNNATPAGTTTSPVQLTANTDIDSMVDKIKEFVEKYNELVSSMNDQLKEKKYRDYPPLTDEQREEMSDNEQKLWDEKAKSGLLRNDPIISNGLSEMRGAIYGRVGSDANVIDTLAEMGITTSSAYSDGGKLVINEEKLRKALTENPDQVVKTFTNFGEKTETQDTRGIAQRLRESIKDFTKDIETKAGKATFTDQQYDIGKRLIDTNDRISNFQRRLEDIESRYWRQFTAMEQAINRANQQSAMLMGYNNG